MIGERDLELGDGRRLRVYDTGGEGLAVFWQHGTPNLGEPPEPLLPERVLSAVCASAPAPFGTEGLDWFAGMAPAGAAELRAATGRCHYP